jgi:hypothetical protein
MASLKGKVQRQRSSLAISYCKPRSAQKCHSERSEESRIFIDLRSFTPFRMTVKSVFAIASGKGQRQRSSPDINFLKEAL